MEHFDVPARRLLSKRERTLDDESLLSVTPEGSEKHESRSQNRTYHGSNRTPCHVWSGFASMLIVKANVESRLTTCIKNANLLKIAQGVFQKWHGLPKIKAVFDSDGLELTSSNNNTTSNLFMREHDWDKHYDAVDDRIFVTHICGKNEAATVAISRGNNCLVTIMRQGEPSAKQVGSLHGYNERAVLVDRSWLKGHMLDVMLKNCTKLSNLFDEMTETSDLKELPCPRAVMEARIQDAVINGSKSRSSVEYKLFSNIDPGKVMVRLGKTAHIQVSNGAGEIGGTLVTSDARIRRILLAYVTPHTGIQRVDGNVARWLVVVVYAFLKHVVNTKGDDCARYERYSQTLGRHRWSIPMLLHMVSCDVQPNLVPASSVERKMLVRMVEDEKEGTLFISTDKRTATELGAQIGEFENDHPSSNPSCIAPGTGSFGVMPVGRVHMEDSVHHINCKGI